MNGRGNCSTDVSASIFVSRAYPHKTKSVKESTAKVRKLAPRLKHSYVVILSFRQGEAFFNEIINHPVPLDMNTLTALKRCSLGLDLYLWLTYRTFTLRASLRLTWRHLYRQFGPNPNNTATNNAIQNFRRRILRELKKIKLAWPELNYATAPGLLILNPSTPAIAPLNQGQLGS